MSNNNTFNVRFPAKQPTKKSIFERQRTEAEAKRQREAAETAAIYEDFVKSFDDGGISSSTTAAASQHQQHQHQHQEPFSSSIPQPKGGSTVGATGGRRHFSIPSSGHGGHRNSGPGSLGGGSSNSRHTDQRSRDGRPSRLSDVRTRLAFGDDDDDDDDGGDGNDGDDNRKGGDSEEEGQIVEDDGLRKSAAAIVDRAEEKATSKPTIRLASMPPGTSPAAVKALVVGSSRLTVDAVRILPTTNTMAATTDRKSVAAIVTLAAETAASDIDAAVSAMQNRYLGFGYYLNLHRHLSSAVVAASSTAMAAGAGSGATAQPFGARPVPPASKAKADSVPITGFAPPSSFHGGGGRHFQGQGRGMGMGMGIPPPSTYSSAPAGAPSHEGILHVPVRAPRDIKKLRMIHKVIEHVLDQGPEFEALLMSRPEVQLEEKWAWLWDARCEAGVWYRYRLWETVTGLHAQRERSAGQAKGGKYVPLFEGSHAWKTPDNPLPYEFDTSLAELVSDSDYNSSDDSEAEAEAGTTGVADDDKETFLNPLEKARLTHLLARLPTTLSKLRKGDIARVTAFAITHASRGANEIVDLIVANVDRPLAYTAANPAYGGKQSDENADDTVDTSGAQLIAVYVVSDILSSSATSGIRHAWRFRQLFDAALRRRNVFASLGRLADKFRWGRLRAEKWKRSIGLVLGHWEGWSVFSAETQAFLVSSFENPPAAAGSAAGDKTVAGDEPPPPSEAANDTATSAKKSRWRTVDTTAPTSTDQGLSASGFRLVDSGVANAGDKMVVDGDRDTGDKKENASNDDEDDEWAYRSDYTDDEALDLACMDDEDIDGEPLEEEDTGRGEGHRRLLDGLPLTADEIRALVGDMDEMSEEGEIATDDDDDIDDEDDDYEAYGMSGLSSLSDSDNEDRDYDDNGVERGVQGGHGRDVAMHDAPLTGPRPREATATATTSKAKQEKPQNEQLAHTTTRPTKPTDPTDPTEPPFRPASRPTGIPSIPSAPSGLSAVQASSKQASPIQVRGPPQSPPAPVRMRLGSSAASSASSAFPPRKRMRAADMFDDSDDEGKA